MKIKQLSDHTLVARGLALLAGAISRNRRWWVYPQLLLFGACLAYTALFLHVDPSRGNLIGPKQKFNQDLQSLKREFPSQDDLLIVVESGDADRNHQFVERLGGRLHADTNLFRAVFYKGDLKAMGSKALLLAPEADLHQLKQRLADYRPFLQEFARATNLISLFDQINKGFRTTTRQPTPASEAMIKAFPALERIVTEATESLKHPEPALSPGLDALFSGGTNKSAYPGYITLQGGRLFLMTAQALRADLNAQAIERLRALIAQIKTEVPGLNVGLTGETVLEHDEMEQSQIDVKRASIVALLACALIFIYGYHEIGRPIKATLCLIIGLGYTLAFATLTVGHLNVLTITFVPIVIGLAIDYGVHLISRYEEELRHGRKNDDAMLKAMVFSGQGIFTGALTTAGAFWGMVFTNFKGIQEMGTICGGGLLLCLIPMMTMLPAMLLPGREDQVVRPEAILGLRRARIERIWLDRPLLVTCSTVCLCAVAATQIRKVYFDYNLLHLQSAGLPAVECEKKLLDSSNRSLLFGAIMATNLQDAAQLLAGLTNLPAVAGVESLTTYFSQDESRRMRLVRDIKAELTPVSFRAPDPRPVDLRELSRTLYSLGAYLGIAFPEVQKADPALAHQFLSLREAITRLRREMLDGTAANLATNARKLGAFQEALLNDFRDTLQALKDQDSESALRVRDLPQVLRQRFVGASGKYLLMVFPKRDVRERENQREFIAQVQAVCPDVSGTPVQLYYYTDFLKRSYEQAARYSLGVIILLVFLHFRSPLCVALALVPVGIGALWLGGIMGFAGIPLNPANIMTLPLVIGIGVTNGIQILNRYAEEQRPDILARSTGKAVLVSGLTSIAGFGSLILAQHQGIKSLGYVMSCGLATCMIAGLTFLPALLILLTRTPGGVKTVRL